MLLHEVQSINDLGADIDLAPCGRLLLALGPRRLLSQLYFNRVVLARQEAIQVGKSLGKSRLPAIQRRERSERARRALKLVEGCRSLRSRSLWLLCLKLNQVIDSLEVRVPLHYLAQAFSFLFLAKDEDLVGLRVNERVAIRLLLGVMEPDPVIYARYLPVLYL